MNGQEPDLQQSLWLRRMSNLEEICSRHFTVTHEQVGLGTVVRACENERDPGAITRVAQQGRSYRGGLRQPSSQRVTETEAICSLMRDCQRE